MWTGTELAQTHTGVLAMSDSRRTTLESVKALSPNIAAVVSALHSSKRGKVPLPVPIVELMSIIPGDGEFQRGVLHGALATLYAMGVLRFDADGVAASSRDSGFFLGSLSKFLHKSIAAIDDPLDDKRDFAKVTRVFETARRRRDHGVEVDQKPLHHRRIVTLIIKSRMKRDWQYKDVYLHEYDADLKQYHLIGRALVGGSPAAGLEVDKQFAHSILLDSLRLREMQYELDASINPAVKCLKRVSEICGAYTQYSYRVFVVKNIDTRLSANSHLKEEKGHGPYRWFTWEEIQNCCSAQDEPIIFSTPDLMKDLDLDNLPISARAADDVRRPASIPKELGYRFSKRQLGGVALLLAFLLSLQMLPWLAGPLHISDPSLSRLAALAQIVSGILAVGSALVFVVRLLPPASPD